MAGPVGPPVELLARLYLDEGLSIGRIAERVGLNLDERLPPRQIAQRLDLTVGQVRYDLLRLGVPRRRCGRPRAA